MRALIFTLKIFVCINFIQAQYSLKWDVHHSGATSYPTEYPVMVIDKFENTYVTGDITITQTDFDYITIKYDSSGNEIWSKTYNGPISGKEHAIFNAVDKFGNVYVTGYSPGLNGNNDFLTIKYNSNGDSLWTARYNSPANGDDQSFYIGIDDSLNVIITGFCYSNATKFDYTTIKYNSQGVQQWVSVYNDADNQNDLANTILVDKGGNVYITGSSETINSAYDLVTIKYNRQGVQKWVKRFTGPGHGNDDTPYMGIDDQANVYVTGSSDSSGGKDFVTIKYDSSGNQKWAMRYNSSGDHGDFALSIAVDKSGNSYVAGVSDSSGFGNNNYRIIKYSTTGILLWDRYYGGSVPGANDRATSIFLDSLSNAYVTGFTDDISGSWNYTTIKYSSAGSLEWKGIYNFLNDKAGYVRVNPKGSAIYVTGYSDNVFSTVKYKADFDHPLLKLKLAIEGLYFPLFTQTSRRDTVKVTLRSVVAPYAIIDSLSAVIDSISLSGLFNFSGLLENYYYIVVNHFNSIETWSKSGGEFFSNSDTTSFDFTTAVSQAYGNNLKLKGGKYCVYSGDVDKSGFIDVDDIISTYNKAHVVTSGNFIPEDLNGDQVVDSDDITICFNNMKNFISVIRP